jgi:hypothetical protein
VIEEHWVFMGWASRDGDEQKAHDLAHREVTRLRASRGLPPLKRGRPRTGNSPKESTKRRLDSSELGYPPESARKIVG